MHQGDVDGADLLAGLDFSRTSYGMAASELDDGLSAEEWLESRLP